MYLPPGPMMEEFSRDKQQSKALLTYLLKLTSVKAFQFALVVVLGPGRTFSPIQKNNGLMPLPPVYTFMDKNYFRITLPYTHTKAVKADGAEIETDIQNDAATEVFQEGYRAKRHEPIFHHLRNINAKSFKSNVDRIFVHYIVDTYDP